jgi:hypothetical protein
MPHTANPINIRRPNLRERVVPICADCEDEDSGFTVLVATNSTKEESQRDVSELDGHSPNPPFRP